MHIRTCTLFLLTCFTGLLHAQNAKRTLRPGDIYRLQNLSDANVSPDGKWVAYTVSTIDSAKDKRNNDIWMVSIDGKENVQLTNSPNNESSPRWSPDGKSIVFEKGAAPKSFIQYRSGALGGGMVFKITENQVWIKNLESGELKMIGQGSYPKFSPNGKEVVFVKYDIDCELQLPSAFSPNGDLYNDGYLIKGIEAYPKNIFRVFNRWGNEVYVKQNYVNTEWMGQNKNGDDLPEGTYFVILQITDKDITKNTYVDLRRYSGKK